MPCSRAPTPHAACRLLLRAAAAAGTKKIFSFTFLSSFPVHARALIDAMGDAAAAATASTSAPATPTSILICLEDGSDLLSDAYDGAGATDFVVARDEHLLVEDQDEEYVALLLSKESAAVCAPAEEETEEWMKTARSGCVRWIIKVVRAIFLLRKIRFFFVFFPKVHLFFVCCSQTTAMFGFGGKTAYVAVTYLDRFLVQRRVNVTALLVTLHFPSPSPLPASPLSFRSGVFQ